MLTIIILGVIGFLAGWFRCRETTPAVVRAINIGMLTIAGMALGAWLIITLESNLPKDRMLVDEKSLVPFENNFVLNDYPANNYIVFSREKAVLKAYRFSQRRATLQEIDDSQNGYLKIYTEQLPSRAWYAPFVFNIKHEKYEIFVPRGNILEIEKP